MNKGTTQTLRILEKTQTSRFYEWVECFEESGVHIPRKCCYEAFGTLPVVNECSQINSMGSDKVSLQFLRTIAGISFGPQAARTPISLMALMMSFFCEIKAV